MLATASVTAMLALGINAAEPDQAAAIRQHRMATLVVQTAPNATVKVTQLRHEFWFGTAINHRMFADLDHPSPDAAKYLEILKSNFNSAVHENAFKWYATEITKDVYTYETSDAILAWCEKNGLRMRGHAIFWDVDKFVPAWQNGMDAAELRAKVEQRARDVMTRYH